MEGGWIKLYRSILDKGWACKPDYLALWVHILMMANHEDREYFWNGRTIVLKPGQLITGRKILSKKTGIHESSIQRILNVFESEHQIEQLKTSTSRLISIKNWGKFQKVEQRSEQRLNNERTTAEQRANTKQELKEHKELKNEKKGVVFTPPTPDQVRDYFFEIGVNGQEFERFHDYYQANGWKIGGKSKMKDWKASCRNWKKNIAKFNTEKNATGKKTGEQRMQGYRDWFENA